MYLYVLWRPQLILLLQCHVSGDISRPSNATNATTSKYYLSSQLMVMKFKSNIIMLIIFTYNRQLLLIHMCNMKFFAPGGISKPVHKPTVATPRNSKTVFSKFLVSFLKSHYFDSVQVYCYATQRGGHLHTVRKIQCFCYSMNDDKRTIRGLVSILIYI